MDEISQGPERTPWLLRRLPAVLSMVSMLSPSAPTEDRVVGGMFAGLAVVAALVAGSLAGGHGAPSSPAPATAQARVATGEFGAAAVSCSEATWWNLRADWRADSVQAGPLWLVGARDIGYVRAGGGPGAVANATKGTQPGRTWLMVVHVDAGATVVLRAAAGTSGYFQFIDGEPVGANQLADGASGLEFPSCLQPDTVPAGWVGLYNVGFYISAGRSAAVEVLSSESARPTWLTFTAPN